MSVASTASEMSAGFSRKRQHFGASFDLSYRFQSPETFNYHRKLTRPHTTPGTTPDATFRSGRYHKAYLTTIASAQLAAAEAIQHSLGDGLLMLRQGHRYVKPSVFSQLDKMYLYRIHPEETENQQNRLSTPTESRKRFLERNRVGRAELTRSARANIVSEAAETRPSTVRKIVVEFLTRAERQERSVNRIYSPDRDYHKSRTEAVDRCARNSDFPDIRIDGRSLGQGQSLEDDYMLREHCEVLGPHSCPDCIRTRAQNSHLRMCNATASANATDMYKLALIHERIPQLSIREVQRKVVDGEISDSVDPVSKWQEVKNVRPPAVKEEIEPPLTAAPSYVHDKTRSKLKSSGSLRSLPFETILESQESGEPQLKEDMRSAPPEQGGPFEIPDTERKPNTNEATIKPTPGALETAERKRILKNRKKSPKRTTRVFNRDLIPSPNYFYNVSDLMDRVVKFRRYRKKSVWDIEISRGDTVLQNVTLPSDSAKQEQVKDDASSVSSQESISPRKRESLKVFEPPVMYGSKSRFLGIGAVAAAV